MIRILEIEAKERGKSVSSLIRKAVYDKYHPMRGIAE